MASDETPVERRLREIGEGGTQCAIELPATFERHAIDCGREAIRLLRGIRTGWTRVERMQWRKERAALLARCTEGPRW